MRTYDDTFSGTKIYPGKVSTTAATLPPGEIGDYKERDLDARDH